MQVAVFTFNDFLENTYLLYDETRDCVIIDPGCNNEDEKNTLIDFVNGQGLKPVRLLNTHCHIDHVLGNAFVSDYYNLPLETHEGEIPVLKSCAQVAMMYGIPYEPSPPITKFLDESQTVQFGSTELKILFTPGHSPASISFYHEETKQIIGGDVLFQGSIGRTDLPGGNMETLLESIRNNFFNLPDDTIVYPGHGPKTSVGVEKKSNPFLRS